MAIETATFVGSLVTSNPPASDLLAQGDDHLRLLKSTLQNTFPVATKAFYFPRVTAIATDVSPAAADDNRLYVIDTTGAPRAVTLPTLAAGLAGWAIDVVKGDLSANYVRVTTTSGTINGRPSLYLGQMGASVRVIWSGSAWFALPTGSAAGVIGEIKAFTGAVAPLPWYLCNGQTIARAEWPLLYSMIGDTYGAGDGSITFNVPNYVGYTLAMIDVASAVLTGFTALGTKIGSRTHTLTPTEIAAHTHGVNDPGHTHNYLKENAVAVEFGTGISVARTSDVTATATTSSTTGISTASAGGGGAHNNVQPTAAVNWIVCAG